MSRYIPYQEKFIRDNVIACFSTFCCQCHFAYGMDDLMRCRILPVGVLQRQLFGSERRHSGGKCTLWKDAVGPLCQWLRQTGLLRRRALVL